LPTWAAAWESDMGESLAARADSTWPSRGPCPDRVS
jgi:hypothetical protein